MSLTSNKIKKVLRYCGKALNCISVTPNDTYDEILQKIDKKICECCGGSGEYFYKDVVLPSIAKSDDFSFAPGNYSTLTYKNNSSSDKTYEVHCSYSERSVPTPNSDILYALGGAIVKTDISNTDSVAYSDETGQKLKIGLFKVSDQTSAPSNEHLTTTPGNLEVFIDHSNDSYASRNKSFFGVVTLKPSESVSLKFKSRMSYANDFPNLLKAQLLVKELQ